MRHSKVVAGGLGVVALLSVASVVQVSNGQSPRDRPGDAAAPASATELGVFARERGTRDVMPSEAATALRLAGKGADPSFARRATGDSVRSLFVVPADDAVCHAITDGVETGIGCDEVSALKAGTAAPGVLLKGEILTLHGIVPDGVSVVTIHHAGGGQTERPTEDNGYLFSIPVDSKPVSFSYDGPNGTVEFPVGDPRQGISP